MVLSPLGVFRVTLKAMQDMRLAGRAPRTADRVARAAKVERMVSILAGCGDERTTERVIGGWCSVAVRAGPGPTHRGRVQAVHLSHPQPALLAPRDTTRSPGLAQPRICPPACGSDHDCVAPSALRFMCPRARAWAQGTAQARGLRLAAREERPWLEGPRPSGHSGLGTPFARSSLSCLGCLPARRHVTRNLQHAST
jgi:hypothetical protein